MTAACEVNASFKKRRFTVSASSGAGGTISPVSQQVVHGDSALLSLKADSGFLISAASGCNGQLQADSYRTGAVIADCKVEAVFAAAKFQVTTAAATGGRLSQQNPQVNYGETLQLTLLPDAGFDITTASGCGGKLRGAVFTTGPITAACTVTARFNADSIVVFPDPQLDKVVRQTLQLDDRSDIAKTQLQQLTTLQMSGKQVADLQGLQYATKLTVINAQSNAIADLSPLQGLNQLQELWLGYNPIGDLTPLRQLSSLRKLHIFDALATDLSPLRGLALTDLGLSTPAVLDLSPLQEMPLQYFYLWFSGSSDLSPLANAPLRYMDVQGSNVQDLSVLKNLRLMWGINISNTLVLDLTPLQQIQNLASLSLYQSRLQDLTILENLNLSPSAALYISGCIDQNGYSRHLEQLNALKIKRNLNLYVGADKRSDCADTLVGTSFSLNAQVSDRTLGYHWQITGNSQPVHCALYLDLDDQQPGNPASSLQACAATGSATYAGYQADQFRPSMWFDNGIGGEKLITLAEVGVAPATAKLQSLDLSQLTISMKPQLVASRDGLLRLHVTANQSPLLLPQFQLELTLNGNSQRFNTIAPKRLPPSKVHRSLSDAYQAVIPAAWMQSGLQITVLQEGQPVRTMRPEFAPARPLAIRIVPIQLGEQVAVLPDIAAIQAAVKTYWPFSQVEVRARAPYQLKAAGTQSSAYIMLPELRDLRAIEGEDVYYYGYFKPEMGDGCCGGLGYLGLPVAVGFDNDNGEILAHELGHNFGRQHVDCGRPNGPDTAYPYAANTVGSVGLSLDLTQWKSPANHTDLMSYCSPKHVSDYNVAAVQSFVQKTPPAVFPAMSAAPNQLEQQSSAGRGLYLSGTIDGGTVHIRTLVPLSRAPRDQGRANPSGNDQLGNEQLGNEQRGNDPRGHDPRGQDYVMRVLDSNGLWSEYAFQLLQIDHQPLTSAREFQLELPQMVIQRVEVWQADRLVAEQQNDTARAATKTLAQQQLTLSDIQLQETANEICVRWAGGAERSLSLLYQLDGTDSVLALNETANEFCRDSSALAPGGDWRLVWRQQLTVREFRQPR